MKKTILFTLALAVSSSAMAIEFWTQPLKIKEVTTLYNIGHNFVVLEPVATITKEDGSAIPFCAKTDAENVVGIWTASALSTTMSAYYATAMNAKNLDTNVQLYLNSASCDSAQAGMLLQGIRMVD